MSVRRWLAAAGLCLGLVIGFIGLRRRVPPADLDLALQLARWENEGGAVEGLEQADSP